MPGLGMSFIRALIPFIRLHLHGHYNHLPSPHLLSPLNWRLGFQHVNLGGHKHWDNSMEKNKRCKRVVNKTHFGQPTWHVENVPPWAQYLEATLDKGNKTVPSTLLISLGSLAPLIGRCWASGQDLEQEWTAQLQQSTDLVTYLFLDLKKKWHVLDVIRGFFMTLPYMHQTSFVNKLHHGGEEWERGIEGVNLIKVYYMHAWKYHEEAPVYN
jgi:hypothetical protein